MSGGKSSWYQAKILDHTLGGTPYDPPASFWVALSGAPWIETATGSACNEISSSGTDYVRIEVPNDTTSFPDAAEGDPAYKFLTLDVSFPRATGDYGAVYSAYLCDAATDGNIIYGSDGNVPQYVVAGGTLVIPANTWMVWEA